MKKIMFVCMGNICRSPAAEGVMKAVLERRGIDAVIESAGTIDYHVGSPADRRMRAAAKERGYDLTSRSQQIKPSDLDTYDLILCADRDNLFYVNGLDGNGSKRDKIKLIMDFVDDNSVDEVPDPYYGGQQGFEHVLDLLEEACEHIADKLESE